MSELTVGEVIPLTPWLAWSETELLLGVAGIRQQIFERALMLDAMVNELERRRQEGGLRWNVDGNDAA